MKVCAYCHSSEGTLYTYAMAKEAEHFRWVKYHLDCMLEAMQDPEVIKQRKRGSEAYARSKGWDVPVSKPEDIPW